MLCKRGECRCRIWKQTRCEVSAAVGASGQRGAYRRIILSFEIGEGAIEFVNNHIPLDPPLDGLVLLYSRSIAQRYGHGG